MTKLKESPEAVKMRERKYLVDWMRRIIFEKSDINAQKAFMAKVAMSAAHHNITLEELLTLNQKEPPV